MHIPDCYLGPQTYLPAWAIMLPLWGWAVRRVERTLRLRQAPLLALGAAFVFVLMLFNIPALGRSSGHAVGAVLLAILLGPWEAMIAISLALAVQALLFGDGGITALAANALPMGVLMPFAGWAVYRLLAGNAAAGSRRQVIAAAVGGYAGINVAALATAVLFGLQPIIAHDGAGRPLFCPYGLEIAVPALAVSHLLIFGPIEAAVTGLVVAYAQRSAPQLIAAGPTVARGDDKRLLRNGALLLVTLAVLAPLGLLARGTAWGEWGADELRQLTGFLPAGMAGHGYAAPLPDYAAPGGHISPLASGAMYILSALIGIAAIVFAGWIATRIASWKEQHDRAA